MRSRFSIAIVLAICLVPGGARTAAAKDPEALAVVVGTGSEVKAITLDTLRELYLRRRRVWPNGNRALPVNLPPDTAARQTFSRRVLGRLPEDLAGYWNRRYFEGVQPPLVLQTPQAVSAYVAVERDAIGYVPLGSVDRDACRVLLVLPAGE